MFSRFSRSWELTKQSWGVLRADKHLMVFPLLSSLLTVLVCVSFFVPAALIVGPALSESGAEGGEQIAPGMKVAGFALLFVLYFVVNVIVTFFNASLISCALARFNGEESGAAAGMSAALKRWPQILGWAAVNATVGVVIQMLKERVGWLGQLVLGLAGVAWNIATFFVVPVLVVEGVGPFKAVGRSFDVLKKTWGESLIAQVGVGLVMGLATLGTLAATIAAGIGLGVVTDSVAVAAVVIGAGILLTLTVALVGSTLKTILVAACYRMATTGTVPEGFEGSTLKGMFAPKR